MLVHFHIVPAPLDSDSSSILAKWNKPSKLALLGRRDELDDEEAQELQHCLRQSMHRAKL